VLKGKMVRIRSRRYFPEQRLWVFIGKVVSMSENWVSIEGKGMVVLKGALGGQTRPVQIDKEIRPLLLPRDNIANIRILPDDFDVDNIELCSEGAKLGIKVKGAPDTWIGEIGEG